MEFEFHVTLDDVAIEDKAAFIGICQAQQVKPLMIVLDKGNYIHQPMMTGVIQRPDFQAAKSEMDRIAAVFQEGGFTVVRKKVEISPKETAYFHAPITERFKPYFEWHGKVEIEDVDGLKQLCKPSGGHISRNSLNPNGKVRFVTVREYESEAQFYERVKQIHIALQEKQIAPVKEQFELCIYDSREELDSGWIS